MPDQNTGLSSAALDLLLKVVETPEGVISGSALDDYHAVEAVALKDSGLLKPHGHETGTASQSDHDDEPVTLSWSAEHGGLGYFSPSAGWVSVPADRTLRYRVDLPVLLARLMSPADVSSRSGPVPLIADLLWEIGEVRLGRRTRRVPVWFARRLHDPNVWRQIRDMTLKRPTSSVRLILTSTSAQRMPDTPIAGHVPVSIRDVVDHTAGLAVHPDILAARLDGSRRRDGNPLTHSEDYSVVTVHGKDHPFTGVKQRALVRQLIEAFEAGSPDCLTAKVLEEAGYSTSVNTIAKALSGRADWREFIEEGGGTCRIII